MIELNLFVSPLLRLFKFRNRHTRPRRYNNNNNNTKKVEQHLGWMKRRNRNKSYETRVGGPAYGELCKKTRACLTNLVKNHYQYGMLKVAALRNFMYDEQVLHFNKFASSPSFPIVVPGLSENKAKKME